mgnify:CR=1 FL=1
MNHLGSSILMLTFTRRAALEMRRRARDPNLVEGAAAEEVDLLPLSAWALWPAVHAVAVGTCTLVATQPGNAAYRAAAAVTRAIVVRVAQSDPPAPASYDVTFSAQGSDTNVDLPLMAKGTGGIGLDVADPVDANAAPLRVDLRFTDVKSMRPDGLVDAVARGRVWTGADAAERGLVDELGGLRTAIRRAKVLAGLDADDKVRIIGYPGSSLRDRLRPKPSSQPTAASLSQAVGAVLVGSAAEALDHVQRQFTGATALWLGDWRF